MEESVVFTFPHQNKWKPCHGAINSTFDFTEIVDNYGLKQGTVWQIMRFVSQFSLKLNIQF